VSSYLTLEEVVEINEDTIRKHGGLHAIRDQAGLESAVARPQNGYYKDPIEEAAALFESLSQNHPFVDGNKRTAFTAAAVFLSMNGYEVSFDDAEAHRWLIGLYETQRLTKTTIESWLRVHVLPLGRDDP
jgi:death on curing protein